MYPVVLEPALGPLDALDATVGDTLTVLLAGGIVLVRLGDAHGAEGFADEIVSAVADHILPVHMPAGYDIEMSTPLTARDHVEYAKNWHIDQSFAVDVPELSMLYGRDMAGSVAPTAFCDGAALLTSLSHGFRKVLGSLQAEHVAYAPWAAEASGQSKVRARHPCIVPVTYDVQTIFLAPATVRKFEGWSERDSAGILAQLWQMMNWPEFGYVHRWQVGDLLIWRNHRYPHRIIGGDYAGRRVLVRTVGCLRTV